MSRRDAWALALYAVTLALLIGALVALTGASDSLVIR